MKREARRGEGERGIKGKRKGVCKSKMVEREGERWRVSEEEGEREGEEREGNK